MTASFDIDSLRAIVAGADLGSFSRAAVQLGRSQSAISMQLKKLEEQAGAQLFVRKGRGLVPTAAGEALIAYARKIVDLNDEAALALGAATTTGVVRLGLPQDFFEDVMPATLTAFSGRYPTAQVDIRAGQNHKLAEEIAAGRLDGAIVYCDAGSGGEGELLCTLPMRWLAHESFGRAGAAPVPLVMFDHPCLFRKAALSALDRARLPWRAAVTTPSLSYVWAALRSKLGIAVRTAHGVPQDMVCVDGRFGLPDLPPIEIRLLTSQTASSAARDMCEILREEANRRIAPGGE
ncbi:LysR substrate-binding domain-containing protein [Stakelama tenebrarum]|uniref:LysR substrate-binding domain-containing protein n=1 Tax=Stakelama tenebrarum TaxID=2711215 RepID=UPI0013EC699B|nr:LysR substrate-binding domain-containing protein [Sphingosinithalassobacter tenebrarum]